MAVVTDQLGVFRWVPVQCRQKNGAPIWLPSVFTPDVVIVMPRVEEVSMGKSRQRLERQFDRLQRRVPKFAAGWLRRIRRPEARWVRIPLGIVLVFGGVFSFLPVLGIWMLPLGLLLLAIDVPFLQRPVNFSVVQGSRKLSIWSRARRDRKAAKN
jgi:hypothetical protein